MKKLQTSLFKQQQHCSAINDTHPSNVLKFCPFCGSKNFIWDNKKSHNCLDCCKRLYTNEIGAVIALIENEKGECLFTTRKFDPAKGKLDLPGGFIDLGETAEQAVVREIKEELNLVVEQMTFLCTLPNQYQFRGLTYFTIDIVFRCLVKDFAPLCANDDVESVHFVNCQEVDIEQIGLDSVKLLVQQLKQL